LEAENLDDRCLGISDQHGLSTSHKDILDEVLGSTIIVAIPHPCVISLPIFSRRGLGLGVHKLVLAVTPKGIGGERKMLNECILGILRGPTLIFANFLILLLLLFFFFLLLYHLSFEKGFEILMRLVHENE
jgi:hypothetical protein